MGILKTIIRARDDLEKPKTKSYWGYKIEAELMKVKDVKEKERLLPSDKRAIKHELSGKEPVEQIIVVRNSSKKLGRFTTDQVKEMLDDMGFNVDVSLSKDHFSDFSAVMNVYGFAIPGWRSFANWVSKRFRKLEKLLLAKLAPGKYRLHIRLFEGNDGSWTIIAHTDVNWNLNLFKVFKAHVSSGAGDYKTGTLMMYKLIKSFKKYSEKNKLFPYSEIEKVSIWGYYRSIAGKLKLELKPALVSKDA